MSKEFIGVLLGLVSFVVLMFFGEVWGLLPAFLAVTAYCAVCQFLLSRGHMDAQRKDWRVMLALGAPLLALPILLVVLEKPAVVLEQGPVALFACAGVYTGAALASWVAKRTAARSA